MEVVCSLGSPMLQNKGITLYNCKASKPFQVSDGVMHLECTVYLQLSLKKSQHFLRLVRIPEAVFLLLAPVSAGVVTEE